MPIRNFALAAALLLLFVSVAEAVTPLNENYGLAMAAAEEQDSSGIIVEFEDGVNKEAKQKILDMAGDNISMAPSKRAKDVVRYEFKTAFEGLALDIPYENSASFSKVPGVKRITPDFRVKAFLYDSVPQISADDVWELLDGKGEKVTGKGITIAIIDTGVDYTNADLGGCTKEEFLAKQCKVAGGYDIHNGDNDPMDDFGHGTHVAAIAAGNGVLKGVAPDAEILAYKVLGSNGGGWMSDVIKGIEMAIDPNQDGNTGDHADIISMSLGTVCLGDTIGGPWYSEYCGPDDPLSKAVDKAVEAGAVATIAAGNAGTFVIRGIASPATARKAIAVGAVSKADAIAWFSSRGLVEWKEGALFKPDIVAPGVLVCAAKSPYLHPRGSYKTCVDDNHILLSGTSMSAPHAAGAAALLLQKHPGWTPQQVKLALKNTAVDLGEEWTTQGRGRINVLDAAKFTNPPTAEIVTTTCRSECKIRGTAAAENFDGYTLSYSTGTRMTEWKVLKTGANPVINGVLAEFDADVLGLQNGVHSLRLEVSSDKEKIEEISFIKVVSDTVHIDFPSEGENLESGKIYEIRGTAVGKNFESYTIVIGEGGMPLSWSDDGIELKNGGKQKVADDVLGTLDANKVPDGAYTLKVSVKSGAAQMEETVVIMISHQLKELGGWPRIFTSGQTMSGYLNGASYVADLDNDGSPEVIKAVGKNLYVLDSMGEIKHGWPRKLGISNTGFINDERYSPAIGDLDGDGTKEIVAASQNGISAWRHDGQGYLADDGTFAKTSTTINAPPTLADLNGDGRPEVIAAASDLKGTAVYVWNPDGTGYLNPSGIFAKPELNSKNNKKVIALSNSPAAVADIDKDGRQEIILPTQDAIFAWKSDGKGMLNEGGVFAEFAGLWNWTMIVSPPIIGDMDGDERSEIIVGTLEGVYVFNSDGTPASQNWPLGGDGVQNRMALGDMDGDKLPEIVAVITSYKNNLPSVYVYVWKKSGDTLAGWPKEFGLKSGGTYPSVGDIDGDGKNEIVFEALNYIKRIYGTEKDNIWLYVLGNDGATRAIYMEDTLRCVYPNSIVSLADVNSDGPADLIFGCNDERRDDRFVYPDKIVLHALDVAGMRKSSGNSQMEWPFFQRDLGHTGAYVIPESDAPAPEPDTAPPAIRILGDNPATVLVNEAYVDAGAIATDNVDGDMTAEIVKTSTVNSNVVGTYAVTYKVTDKSGNEATATRTVDVVDTVPPVINVTGNNPVTVALGSVYTDAGATATDNVDGDITTKIITSDGANTAAVGTYSVTYTVADAAGNTATAIRKVIVVDATAPVIMILGDNPVAINAGTAYADAGAIATDNVDGDLTAKILTSNNVNTAVAGTYFVTYQVEDAAGNAATVSRRVTVLPIYADMKAVSIKPHAADITVNADVNYTFVLLNSGPWDVDEFYYEIDFGDGKAAKEHVRNALKAGSTLAILETHKYAKAGSYKIKFSTSAPKKYVDTNLQNNMISSSVKVRIFDLAVISVKPRTSPVKAGQPAWFDVVIQNKGDYETMPFKTYVTIDFDDRGKSSSNFPPLAPNSSKTLSFQHIFPEGYKTEYNVKVSVKSYDKIDGDPSNDQLAINIRIAYPKNKGKPKICFETIKTKWGPVKVMTYCNA